MRHGSTGTLSCMTLTTALQAQKYQPRHLSYLAAIPHRGIRIVKMAVWTGQDAYEIPFPVVL